MFDKIAVMTDLHVGHKNNSKIHNQDCEDFIDWFIETAHKHGCETGLCCGDYHHNRNTINITTLHTSLKILEKLGKAFDKFYFFPGNHDLYYRDRRDIQSIEFAKHIHGIHIVNEITEIDGVALVPWLIEDEWKKIKKIKSPIMFGHFELPSFYMNAMVKMPDTGELKAEQFKNQDFVFSGHFHKRQHNRNIYYMGNCFPHNYADAGDDDRGMMIFDMSKQEPEFINWDDCPKYRTTTLSRLLDDPDKIITPKSHLKITLDIPVSFEEATFIKESFIEKYECREIKLIPKNEIEEVDSDVDISQFKSVDEIVSQELTQIESDSFDKTILLDIYKNL